MKIVAYTALHYGRDYLRWAIRSVIDYVDEYVVLYSAVGSHGHKANSPCPETREELMRIASDAAKGKLAWYDGSWSHEGEQRDTIHDIAPQADAVIVLDADEIWPYAAMIPAAIEFGIRSRRGRLRLPMVHFWRSFHRAVLHDPAFPVRILLPKIGNEAATYHTAPIAHMGYAQRTEIVDYKQLTHGHRGEWRRDIDWFRERYLANAKTDCHPVGSEYWNPEPVEYRTYLPAWMEDHPYATLEVIP